MKKRQIKKKRKLLYTTLIEDVTLEISLDTNWRKKIFELMPSEILEITYLQSEMIPQYIKKEVVKNRLSFIVTKVNCCEEYFDSSLEIFKFQSKEYPQIVRYSGNNPSIL